MRGTGDIHDLHSLATSGLEYIQPKMAAHVLGVDKREVLRAIENGELPYSHLGREKLISVEYFLQYLADQQRAEGARPFRGEGTIYQYDSRGLPRWRVQWYEREDPKDPESPVGRRSKSGFRSWSEALAYLRERPR